MARALGFRHGSTELAFGLEKLDRKKLYGFVDSEVLDGGGRPCELAVLASDGVIQAARAEAGEDAVCEFTDTGEHELRGRSGKIRL